MERQDASDKTPQVSGTASGAPSPSPEPSVRPESKSLRLSLTAYGLGELLVRLAERRVTGRLVLAGGSTERTLTLLAGYPVFARSSLFSERIGALGVRHGYFGREDVRAALALSGQHQKELGRALLELETVDGVSLFTLLSQQHMLQLATAVGPSWHRASFVPDAHVADNAVVMRVHPLTATLAAVRGVTVGERERALEGLASRSVAPGKLPMPAQEWLQQIGYMGDPALLTEGSVTVGAIRSRLVARMRPHARRAFDPARAPGPTNGVTPSAEGIPAMELATLLVLTLLASRSIALTAPPPEQGDDASDSGSPPSPGLALKDAIEAASGRPPLVLPDTLDGGSVPMLPALERYLTEPREGELAARLNAWGAAGEIDPTDLSLGPLMTLYLTVRAEPTPEGVLGAEPNDPPEAITTAYQEYASFLASLRPQHPLTVAKVAELQLSIDNAFRALRPGEPLPQPPEAAPDERHEHVTPDADITPAPNPATTHDGWPDAEGTPTEFFESVAAFEAAAGSAPPAAGDATPPAPDQVTTAAGRRTPLSSRPPRKETLEELTTRVEAQLVQGDWGAVLNTLERKQADGPLPPVLRVALAIAQREHARMGDTHRSLRSLRALAWLAVGAGLAWLVHLYLL